MDNTIIQQGRFTSDGENILIPLRSDVDWMMVYNFTEMSAQNDVGVQYYWQRGFAQGTGLRYFKSGGTDALNVLNLAAPLGFTLVDTSIDTPGAAIAVTATSNATQPVVSTGNTAGLTDGSVVRLIAIANRPNLGGIDFSIDTIVANTSFTIAYPLANAPGLGGAGFYRRIPFDPMFYPRRRTIANITQAAQAVVTLTVPHQLAPGQQVRFTIPAEWGMIELDGQQATVVDIDVPNNTVTIDIDTTGYTAFAFPLAGDFPFTQAQMVPFGEDTAEALDQNIDTLTDATENQAQLGIILTGGADSPGGDTNDVMYWVAGKSFSVDND